MNSIRILLVCLILVHFPVIKINATSPINAFPADLNMSDEMIYSSKETRFSLWAPTAQAVELRIYENGTDGDATVVRRLQKATKGVWKTTINSDLKGKFYTFKIKYNGNWLAETPGIWTKAVGINGNRAAIIDLKQTNPANWANDKRPALKNYTDIVIYEMHHRDLSVAANSGIKNKGKFLALTETGTNNGQGKSTGIDHLKELGVTHLHLLPSYDYGSVDESKPEIKKYNWGYDPKNYNAPEGSYSTNPADPSTRIREFKQMVQAAHNNGLRIIMDVVYNHTYVNDGSNFSLTVPKYFYRQTADGNYSNASACGNETASERAMMRHYMIESVKYWAKEYHVDGFRFDLMGIHDIETMNLIRKALDEIDPTIFIYGEGWTAGASPLPKTKQALKENGKLMPRIAVFSDDLRDAVKGPFNSEKTPGFVGGKSGLEESVKFGVVGATQHPQIDYSKINYSKAPYANNPGEVINYVSCHDDMCLNDKLNASAEKDATPEMLKRRNLLAQTMVFTSQGVPFIYAGEEIFRNKKGVHNSFESPDSINEIDWSFKNRYADVFEYYKNLIQLRKNHPAFRMNKTEDVQKHLQFLKCSENSVVAFTLSENANGDSWKNIVVIYNGNNKKVTVEVPAGKWTLVAFDGKIDLNSSIQTEGNTMEVPALSAVIAYSN